MILLLLALLQAPDKTIIGRTTFPSAEEVKAWSDKGPEYKNVLDIVLKRDTWKAAVKFIEEKLAPFGDDWTLTVSLAEWEGTSPSEGDRKEKAGAIRFNLKRLSEYERRMIDLRRQEAELRKQRKKFAWKVPPLKYDRLIVHELVHILQGPYASRPGFTKGWPPGPAPIPTTSWRSSTTTRT